MIKEVWQDLIFALGAAAVPDSFFLFEPVAWTEQKKKSLLFIYFWNLERDRSSHFLLIHCGPDQAAPTAQHPRMFMINMQKKRITRTLLIPAKTSESPKAF